MRKKVLPKEVILLCLLSITFSIDTAFTQCIGGLISDSNAQNQVYTCAGDGNPDLISFTTTGSTDLSEYAYVLTNTDNEIIAFVDGASQDFEGAGVGNCYVWGFAYTGEITAGLGESVFNTQFSTACWQISSTRIDVFRNPAPQGGMVSSVSGETTVNICLEDGIPDYVGFKTTGSSFAQYEYLITNEDNLILGVVENGFHNFENAGAGICRVWGLAYTGQLNAPLGTDASSIALSDDCFSLSANYITINRSSVDGGLVSTSEGENFISICTNDDISDLINFQTTNNASGKYIYVITNESNELLSIVEGNSIDFEGVSEGTCRVWGFSFSGNILLAPGQSVWGNRFSDGCFKISSTAVTIVRSSCEDDGEECSLEPALITSSSPTIQLCEAQDETEEVMLSLSDAPTLEGTWVIATAPNESFVSFIEDIPLDLSGLAFGEYSVFYLSFEGEINGLAMGNTIADLEGCFVKSNSIEIDIEDIALCGESCEGLVDGATIFGPEEFSEFNLCFEAIGEETFLPFFTTSTSDASYAYVITDDQNNIKSFGVNGGQLKFEATQQFESVRVWGVSYTGNLQAFLSGNITTATLSTECFSVSSNFISINKGAIQGGTLSLADGTSTAEIQADRPSTLSLNNSDASYLGANYVYLVFEVPINDGGGEIPSRLVDILALSRTGEININPSNPDFNIRIYGLAYSGELLIEANFDSPLEVILSLPFSTACYDLSDNFIELIASPEQKTTAIAATFGDIKTTFDLAPNPAQHFTKVQIYSATQNSRAQLALFDIAGKRIRSEAISLNQGQNNFEVDTQTLTHGIYIMTITSPHFSAHRKLTIQ